LSGCVVRLLLPAACSARSVDEHRSKASSFPITTDPSFEPFDASRRSFDEVTMQATEIALPAGFPLDGVATSPAVKPKPPSATAIHNVWSSVCWILCGNVVYAFSQYGMLVALAKVSTPRH